METNLIKVYTNKERKETCKAVQISNYNLYDVADLVDGFFWTGIYGYYSKGLDTIKVPYGDWLLVSDTNKLISVEKDEYFSAKWAEVQLN